MNEPLLYLLINDLKQGPYALDQIRGMWSSGAITADTLYWQEGKPDWGQVHALISQQATSHQPLQTNVFYLDQQNNVTGPVAEESLKELHQNQVITALTQVCREGDTEWHPYHMAYEKWKRDTVSPQAGSHSESGLLSQAKSVSQSQDPLDPSAKAWLAFGALFFIHQCR